MSERKVLQKYYPPDFDYRTIQGRKGPKRTGPRIQTVRLMAPFSMRCTTCGEFIYKGRTFNAKKETNFERKYLGVQIFFFYIKCTRCSAEITFRTDPKNSDYAMVNGALRNREPWRNLETEAETMEERLDRLEREEAEAAGEEEKNAMADLEAKNADAKREMEAADALDEIRYRNARINRSEKEGIDYADLVLRAEDEERAQQEKEDEEAARRAFSLGLAVELGNAASADTSLTKDNTTDFGVLLTTEQEPSGVSKASPAFKRVLKRKKDHSALLGIRKKSHQ